MALIKINSRKILTGEIKLEKVVPIKYQPYDFNAKGATVVDLNVESLNDKRRLLSMFTEKPSQNKFNQVVDTAFQDFPIQENDNSIILLQSRLNSLISERNSLLNERDTNRDKVADLNKIIDSLRKQLQDAIDEFSKFKPGMKGAPALINDIPDQISLNGVLYSDRQGRKNDPGYPVKQNMLLSKNRQAKLILQEDGNAIITKGEYDGKGNPTAPDEVIIAFGWDNGASKPNYLKLERPKGPKTIALVVGGLQPLNTRWSTPIFTNISNKAKLVLDDLGILSIYDGDRIIWTSFGIDPQDTIYNPATAASTFDTEQAALSPTQAIIASQEAAKKEEEKKTKKEERKERNKERIDNLREAIKKVIGFYPPVALYRAIKKRLDAGESLSDILKDFTGNVTKGIGNVVQNIGQGISNVAQNVGKGISNVAQNIAQGVSTAAQNIAQGVSAAAQNVVTAVTQSAPVQAVVSTVSNVASSIGKGIKKLFSDRSLKTDIVLVGQSPNGINVYEFSFINDPQRRRYQGVIADELIGTVFESALSQNEDGYLVVDYAQLDVEFKEVNTTSAVAGLRKSTGKGYLSGNSGNARVAVVKSKSNIRNNRLMQAATRGPVNNDFDTPMPDQVTVVKSKSNIRNN